MTRRTVRRSNYHVLAARQLEEWLGDQTRVTLGHACRELSRVDEARFRSEGAGGEPRLGDRVRPDLVSRLLRSMGFRKVGMEGTGYDREPVYAKPGKIAS